MSGVQTIAVTEDEAGMRVDRWFKSHFPNVTHGQLEKYLRKGSKVYLEGSLQTRKWTDQSGQERYTTEVVLQRYRGEMTMLDTRGGGGGDFGGGGGDFGGGPPAGGSGGGDGPGDLDDEIPF